MLTPPYHFAIPACPPLPAPTYTRSITEDEDDNDYPLTNRTEDQVLYRGSIPSVRNLAFVKRLHLRTILCLCPAPVDKSSALGRFAARYGIELRWIKADKMGEEKMGMGKGEVGEALKVINQPDLCVLRLAHLPRLF